jgi:hypothetical protein
LVEGYPESTSIRIEHESAEGFVFLNTGSTKTEKGHQQIKPGYKELVSELPEC